MYDFAVPNSKPGDCAKCSGAGVYRWGAIVNGRATHVGKCWSCKGTGKQSTSDIHRNIAYNRFKVSRISGF
jgi:DnaJ-class molecular chaperone